MRGLYREYWLVYRRSGFYCGRLIQLFAHHLPWASCLSFSVFLCFAGRAYWRERGEWVGKELNHSLQYAKEFKRNRRIRQNYFSAYGGLEGCTLHIGFPTEFSYEWVSRNRDKTNLVITRNKVVISRNSVFRGMAYFLSRNRTKRNEKTRKSKT